MNIKVLSSGSKGNAYLITCGDSSLLIECGISIKDLKRGLDYRLTSVDACLISHDHGDHARAAADVARAGVEVCASVGTIEALGLSGHRIHELERMRQGVIGPWTVLPFDARHDCAEPLGFLIANGSSKLLYLTDSAYCPYRFEGITHWLLEVNYDLETMRENVANQTLNVDLKNRIIRNHFSLENAVKLFEVNDLSRTSEIVLIHLSDSNSNEARIKRAVQEVCGKVVRVA